MKNISKRIISVLLALCIIMSLGAIAASAAEYALKLTVDGFKDGQQVSVVCMKPAWNEQQWYNDDENLIYLNQATAQNGVVNVNVPVSDPVAGEYYIIVNGVIYRQALLGSELPDESVTADKDVYLVNEEVTLTVVTSQDAVKLGVFNENGKGISKLSSTYVDVDGARVWTVVVKIGTKGNRTISVKALAEGESFAGKDYLGSVNISVVKQIVETEPVQPVIISVAAPETAIAKQSFVATVTTSKAVANVGLFNENGTGITCSKSYADSGDNRVWTITASVASAGARTLVFKAAETGKNWLDDTAKSFEIKITKK